jgi:hypothetical protein
MRTNESVESHPPALHSGSERHEEDFMTVQMIAGKLQRTAEWVESKCRRSSNPIPFHDVGNHRLFLLSEVHAWVMKGSPHAVTEAGGASAPIDPSQILTMDEVAARLKVNPRVVYNLTRVRSQNPIPHFRVGQALRFNWLSVSAWLQGQKAA